MTSYSFLRLRSKVSSRLLKAPLRLVYNLYGYVDHLTSGHSQLIARSPIGEPDTTEDVSELSSFLYITHCLYKLEEVEINFLKNLRSNNKRTFIVCNCNQHLDHPTSDIGPIWTRQNRGRDLGAIRDFMRMNFDLIENSNLCIINSSCFWSQKRLQKMIIEISCSDRNGILFGTKSLQGVEHFQSYLIVIPMAYLQTFANITENFRNWRSKRAAVVFGEYKLTLYLKKEGLRTQAIYSEQFKKIALGFENRKQNPSIAHAGILLDFGAPFVKKSAFSKSLLKEYKDELQDFT